MATAGPTIEQALEHEKALYQERMAQIQERHRTRIQETKKRGPFVNGISSDDEVTFCLELASARAECRIEMLSSVPGLGSDENLNQLFSEIECSVNVRCTAVIDAIRRHHAASGYPETVLEAQRVRIEHQFRSAAADAVANAKRKLKLAISSQEFGLPSGLGNAATATAPKVQHKTREFHFIADSDLRAVLERDYQEIQRALSAGCWKSVIILSGGAIETVLLDLLQKNATAAKTSLKAARSADLTRWDLIDLIRVAVDCKLVSDSVERLSTPVREYRNLIHPGNEIRNKLKFDAEEARIALDVLNIVCRELA